MKRLTRALSLWLAVFLVAGSLYVPAFASETEEGQENAVTVVDGIGLNEEGNSSEDQYVEENNSVDNDLQETAEVENVEQETGAPEIPADSASESVEVNPSEQEVQASEEGSGNSNQNLIEEVPSETAENSEQGGSDTGTEAVTVPALPEQGNDPAGDSIVEPGITEEIPAAVPANDALEGNPLENAVALDLGSTFSGTFTEEGETSHYYSFTPASDGRYSFSLESEEAVDARLYETSVDTCLYDSSTAEEGSEFCLELQGGVTYYLQVWKQEGVAQATYSLTVRQIFYLTLNATDGYYAEGQKYIVDVERGSNFFDRYTEMTPTAPEGMQFAGWSETEGGELLKAPYFIYEDVTLFAVWIEEETIDAQDLTLGESLSNTFTGPDEAHYYRFVPDETGYYKFFSENQSGDTRAELYQGTDYFMQDDYSGPGNSGFRILRELQAGQEYYLAVRNRSDEVGSYSVCVVKPDVVNVTLHANGGYFYDDSDTITEIYEKGEAFVRFSGSTPSHQDETLMFYGWSESSDGDYIDTLTLESDVDLYAKWGRRCTITFDATDGHFEDYVTDEETGEQVLKQLQTLSANLLEGENFFEYGFTEPYAPDGKIFVGWSEDPEGSALNSEEPFYINDNVTLYAVWETACTVTFDANGGSFINGYYDAENDVWRESNTRTISVAEGENVFDYGVTEPDAPEDGGRFLGWKLDGSENLLDMGEPLYITADTTLYAVWADTFTVTFDAGEGYFNDDPEQHTCTQEYEDGENFWDYAGSYFPKYKDDEKVWQGWKTENDVAVDSDFVITDDITVYAVWQDTCKITLYANGGYFKGENEEETYTDYYERKEAGYSFNQCDFNTPYNNDADLVFYGWSEDPKCNEDPTGCVKFEDFTTVSRDIELYAVWGSGIKLTFDANGGYFENPDDENEPGIRTVTVTPEDSSYGEYKYSRAYRDDKYVFVGWSMTSDGDPLEDGTEITGDITLYAVWEEGVYVTFKANGGYFVDDDGNRIDTFTEKYSKREHIYTDERNRVEHDSLYFQYWSTKPDGDFVSMIPTDNDITLYAVWVPPVTVTFDANGGTFSEDGPSTITETFAKGSTVYGSQDYSIYKDDENVIFDGWSETKGGQANQGGIVVEKDTTLYAVWAPAVKVTLDANGGFFYGNPEIKTDTERVAKGSVIHQNEPTSDKDPQWVFGGYSTSKTGQPVPDDYKASNDITLYAVWLEPCTVTFLANGGSFGDIYDDEHDEAIEDAQSFKEVYGKGEILDFDNWDDFENLNYVKGDQKFIGFSTAPDGEVIGSEGIKINGDMSLYAIWGDPCKITFDGNGGYYSKWNHQTERYDQITTYEETFGKGRKLSKQDYTWVFVNSDKNKDFIGWSTSKTGNPFGEGGYTITGDTTLYAFWASPGWNQYAGGWKYYVDSDKGFYKSEWAKIDGKQYYFNGNEYRVTGLQTIEGKKYYFNADGVMQTGLQTISGKKYYFGGNGVMQTGWQTISGKKYYFDGNGVMQTGLQTISGKKYYFDGNGIMQTGWQTIGGKKHYFDGNGVMQTGLQTIGGKKYYFDGNGVMLTGWQTIGGKKHYFDGNGVMLTGLQTISGKKYYFDGNGAMQTGWQTIGGKKHYFDGNGVMQTGLQTIGGKKYYFDGNGVMQTGWQTIGGKKHYFDGNGVMQTGWQKISNAWYYFNGNGEMLTGWQKISNKWYYFNGNGVMLTGWQKISNKWYYFNGSGAMLTGWQKISNKWYYFNGSGAMLTGWQKISNKWYYFNGSGAMLTGWQKISSKWYYFNGSGAMLTGWQKISGKYYYFDGSGAMVSNKWVGNYYLTSSGVMATNTWIGNYYVDGTGKWVKSR